MSEPIPKGFFVRILYLPDRFIIQYLTVIRFGAYEFYVYRYQSVIFATKSIHSLRILRKSSSLNIDWSYMVMIISVSESYLCKLYEVYAMQGDIFRPRGSQNIYFPPISGRRSKTKFL